MWAHWRHLTSTIELVLPSTYPSPQTQTVNWSVQPFLQGSRQTVVRYISATWWIRLKLCTLAPPDEYDWTHASFSQPDSTTQTANRSVQPFLHSWRQNVPILYNGMPLSPSKLPLHIGDLDPRLIHGSQGQPDYTTQTANRSVKPFLQGSLVWQTDWQTMPLGR